MDKCLITNKEKNRKIKESMNHKENQRNKNIKEINLNSKKTERTKIVLEDLKEEEERVVYNNEIYKSKIYSMLQIFFDRIIRKKK